MGTQLLSLAGSPGNLASVDPSDRIFPVSLMRSHVSHEFADMFFQLPAAAAADSLILLQLRVFEALMSLPFDGLKSHRAAACWPLSLPPLLLPSLPLHRSVAAAAPVTGHRISGRWCSGETLECSLKYY